MIYKNNNSSCKLTLYKDGTYKYKTPIFFGSSSENGQYKIRNNILILETKNLNNKDSVLNIEYFCANDTPGILKVRTVNCENKNVSTTFKINSSNKIYKTNAKGECLINYQQLATEGINKISENIHCFIFFFNGKVYKINLLKDYTNSRKPEELVFRLNDYAGEKFRPLIRNYKFQNDTIFINDIDRKLIGFYNAKMYKD
jgi:hypothetical protein